MRSDVSYLLDNKIRLYILKVRDVILTEIKDLDIFLFGSIAKGCYSKDSDIDLLLLCKDDKSTKELRLVRHRLEDLVEGLNIEIDVDIKLYSNNRYNEICNKPCFEKSILDDLIDIKGWEYGKS